MARRQWLVSGSVTSVLALTLWSCGGGGSPAGPSSGGGGGGGTPVETTTVTITSAGVSPKAIIVNAGSKIMFVNNDSRAHEPSSNPHPLAHAVSGVEHRQPGPWPEPRKRAHGGWTDVRLHNHLDDSNGALQGTVQTR